MISEYKINEESIRLDFNLNQNKTYYDKIKMVCSLLFLKFLKLKLSNFELSNEIKDAMYNNEDKIIQNKRSVSSSSSESSSSSSDHKINNFGNSNIYPTHQNLNFKNFELPPNLKDQLPYYYQQNMFPHNPINPFFSQKAK